MELHLRNLTMTLVIKLLISQDNPLKGNGSFEEIIYRHNGILLIKLKTICLERLICEIGCACFLLMLLPVSLECAFQKSFRLGLRLFFQDLICLLLGI
ncbi:hypothetical protein L1987_63872 [Smallanthus sonchifolius]|uniref:Uncharacterized protein n=1 Tax=Smallanthus sonchifolius TaxID=185202 RepID=A0ACB9CEQ8_9ASTR|nr:hypothetical protein L1987_63872 [Smallanthus sonchifolius]